MLDFKSRGHEFESQWGQTKIYLKKILPCRILILGYFDCLGCLLWDLEGLSPCQLIYRYISLKSTISSQHIFQCLVRNKQFKFSRVFLFWFFTYLSRRPSACSYKFVLISKRAKIWTAYLWPNSGRSAAGKRCFWAWCGCTIGTFNPLLSDF